MASKTSPEVSEEGRLIMIHEHELGEREATADAPDSQLPCVAIRIAFPANTA